MVAAVAAALEADALARCLGEGADHLRGDGLGAGVVEQGLGALGIDLRLIADDLEAVDAVFQGRIVDVGHSRLNGVVDAPLPALARAGIGHLYFESIHPFEDGNGRIGRALAEKSLAQNIGRPTLIALAHAIEQHRKVYYDQLEMHQRRLDITGWLTYFAQTIIEAQQTTLARVAFHIRKAQFYDRFRGQMNERQEKVIARMFREGPGGFIGGLSAENYITITAASRPTATRDLQDLVQKGALTRMGERRYTRYRLNL